MIQGVRRTTDVSKEDIHRHLSEEQIYKNYVGDFVIGEAMCNPLRDDHHPSLVIRETNGHLHHYDYGDSFYEGDCFHIVMQKYRCDYNSAIQHILRDFGISPDVVAGSGVYEPGSNSRSSRPHKVPKIHVVTRNFNQDELQFWNRYLQDISDLRREHIYAPKIIYRNYQKLPIKGLVFCFYYPDVDKWKIYRPGKPKREKDTPAWEFKWDTNLSYTYCENLESVKGSTRAMLVGKKKDRMYLSKLLEFDAIANVQAEDPATISVETMEVFQAIPDRWANGDSDDRGRGFTAHLRDKGFSTFNGDMPDLANAKGHAFVKQFIKTKGWIQ